MKTKYQYLIIVILLFTVEMTFSQVKTLTNVRPTTPTDQLGWDNTGTPGDLQIRNDFTGTLSDINFWTNGSQQMALDENGNFRPRRVFALRSIARPCGHEATTINKLP